MFIVSYTVLGTQDIRVNKMDKNSSPCVTSSRSDCGRDKICSFYGTIEEKCYEKKKSKDDGESWSRF